MLISAPCYYPGLFADLHHDNHRGTDWKARLALWTTAGDVDFGAQVFYQTKTASSAQRRANEDTVIVGIQLNVVQNPDLLSVSWAQEPDYTKGRVIESVVYSLFIIFRL